MIGTPYGEFKIGQIFVYEIDQKESIGTSRSYFTNKNNNIQISQDSVPLTLRHNIHICPIDLLMGKLHLSGSITCVTALLV
jgi:hypothetical protein